MKVVGPISFEYLLEYNGVRCETYRQFCINRGLLENEIQWEYTMDDAVLNYSPTNLRSLFAILLNTYGI